MTRSVVYLAAGVCTYLKKDKWAEIALVASFVLLLICTIISLSIVAFYFGLVVGFVFVGEVSYYIISTVLEKKLKKVILIL